MDDFDLAQNHFSQDEDLSLLVKTLRLSEAALKYDPHQLPGQILGRISKVRRLSRLSIYHWSPCIIFGHVTEYTY